MRNERSRPITASITGIDGAGKSTVSEVVTSQLPSDMRIAKISRPVYAVMKDGKVSQYDRMMGLVDKVHSFADEHGSRRLSLAANALDVVLQGRVIEPGLKKKTDPHLVLGTRDYIIDPSVYSTFYSRYLGNKSPEERVDFFRRITGSSIRDLVFFLTVPPDEAVARIDRRIAEEAQGSDSTRLKWRHMHEQPDHLARLQSEYYQVLEVVSRVGNPEIVEIDTTRYTKHQVADIITKALEQSSKLTKKSA